MLITAATTAAHARPAVENARRQRRAYTDRPAGGAEARAEAIQAHVASLRERRRRRRRRRDGEKPPPQPLVGKPSADYMARQRNAAVDVNYGPDGGEVSQRVVEVTMSGAAVASESAAITGGASTRERRGRVVGAPRGPRHGGEPPKLVRAFLERSLATIEHALASSEPATTATSWPTPKKKKAPKRCSGADLDKAAIDEVNDEIVRRGSRRGRGGGGRGRRRAQGAAVVGAQVEFDPTRSTTAIVAVVRRRTRRLRSTSRSASSAVLVEARLDVHQRMMPPAAPRRRRRSGRAAPRRSSTSSSIAARRGPCSPESHLVRGCLGSLLRARREGFLRATHEAKSAQKLPPLKLPLREKKLRRRPDTASLCASSTPSASRSTRRRSRRRRPRRRRRLEAGQAWMYRPVNTKEVGACRRLPPARRPPPHPPPQGRRDGAPCRRRGGSRPHLPARRRRRPFDLTPLGKPGAPASRSSSPGVSPSDARGADAVPRRDAGGDPDHGEECAGRRPLRPRWASPNVPSRSAPPALLGRLLADAGARHPVHRRADDGDLVHPAVDWVTPQTHTPHPIISPLYRYIKRSITKTVSAIDRNSIESSDYAILIVDPPDDFFDDDTNSGKPNCPSAEYRRFFELMATR